jgi:4-amino-4-deoxy-L-arabinose transferase-like glycosyltransferase
MKPHVPLAVLACVSLVGIFDHGLWTPDEPRDAEISREIAEGDWLVPTLNRRPHLEKPPLYFWTVAASYKLFGVSAWAARIPSILFAWGTLAFTFLLARRIFGRDAAWLAALVLGTTIMFLDISHKCAVDIGLVFFTTGTFYFLHRAWGSERKLPLYLAAYAMCLGGFFCKGLIGVAIPAVGYAGFLLWDRNPREFLRAQPWLAAMIVGGGAAAWLLSLPPELRDVFLIDNHLGRFTGHNYTGGHARPFYYYGPGSLYAFSPWTLALIPALPWAFRNNQNKYLLLWLFGGLLLLTIATTKREIYLLPMCPAAAILVAGWFEHAPARPRWAAACLAVFEGLLIVGHLALWLGAIALQSWVGLGLALGASAGGSFLVRRQEFPRWLAMGTASLAVSTALILFPVLDEAKNFESFCRRIPEGRLAAHKPDETTLAVVPFYTGRYFETDGDLMVVLVKRERDWEELEKLKRDFLRVVASHQPAPLVLFGARIRTTDRSMFLLARDGR